jgi:hypothetical protein
MSGSVARSSTPTLARAFEISPLMWARRASSGASFTNTASPHEPNLRTFQAWMQEAIDGSSFRSSSIVRPGRLLQSKQRNFTSSFPGDGLRDDVRVGHA